VRRDRRAYRELVINLNTAKALGLTIPPLLLVPVKQNHPVIRVEPLPTLATKRVHRASHEIMRICAGGLLVRRDQVLLAKRSSERPLYPGVWDLVGGHCEAGEAPRDTLIREVQEEIGVTPRAFEEIAVLAEPRPAEHGEARYHIFLVTNWGGGEPRLQGSEHSELRWVSLECALALPLAHPEYGGLISAALAHKRDI
jgi:8-oxo-dGTP diphosphatase